MTSFLQIALASLIAGAIDTVAGFGGGLLLMPLLVIFAGSKQAVLLSALIPLGWNIPRIILLREWIGWRAVALFALGIIPGTYLGAMLLDLLNPHMLQLAIGLLLILFGVYYVLRLYVELPAPGGLRPWGYPIVGLVSGVVGGLLGAGHGPLQTGALAATSLSTREVAATNGALGGVTALARTVGYALQGQLDEGVMLYALVGILFAAGGAVIGVRVSRRTKDSTLELVIGLALVLAGIRMMVG